MLKKILLIVAGLLGVVLIFLAGQAVYFKIKINRGDLIVWDGKVYTKEEFRNQFPPQEYKVEAKNTPEQVYADFRQALINNDIEGALRQIREENRAEYRKAFEDKVKLTNWVKGLPEKITNVNINNNFGSYFWDKKDGFEHTIEFIKNSNGYWQIDQI